MIELKRPDELAKMRLAGRIVAKVLELARQMARPAISTLELDEAAEEMILAEGAEPAFKGYRGYPSTICVSVNEEVVHGLPGPRLLAEGDLVSIDVGSRVEGYYGDAAITLPVGKVNSQAKRLLETTRRALDAAIEALRPGCRLGDISKAIEQTAKDGDYSVVRSYTGHGIGRRLHEDPMVPNYYDPRAPGAREKLLPGVVLAIEPMVNAGTWRTVVRRNGWTVVTADRRLSAHFEHTVALTAHGPEVLTAL